MQPLGNNVIIKQIKSVGETTTAGGIVLSGNNDVQNTAKVVAIGPDVVDSTHDIKVNDTVVFGGQMNAIKYNNEEYFVCDVVNIYAKI